MIKPKLYTGGPLKGLWLFTRKLDGVRMLRDDQGNPVSRAGKPLHNLQEIPAHITDAEIFVDNWETSVSLVRTHEGKAVPASAAYTLDILDTRLYLFSLENPQDHIIENELIEALARGDEGLVLYQGDKALKVKPKDNYDVPVTGSTDGKGKYEGLIGALITPRGKVSGMSDEQRKQFSEKLPEVIEVECMGLTKNFKFRHPRFLRERFDKSIEDCNLEGIK
jgi:hypothetical protein